MIQEQPASAPRAILNANRGISNVIEEKVIRTDLRRVTNNIFDVLKHHYGPYSGFAAKDDGQPLNETVFTKDGIGIVRAIEYASPQEEWVRKTIAYIGSRMEMSVGDGTTSAMMFTCAMLRHMSEHLDEIRPISYNTFKNGFKEFVDTVKKTIDEKYTVYPYKDAEHKELDPGLVYRIVENQVYTSAHGDEELSKVLAEMYKNIPQEQWERMVYERCRYETDKDYEVVASEGQYQMTAEVMTSSMLNKDLCTRFEKENCTVIIMNDSWRCDSPDWSTIMNIIDSSASTRPVVVVCHMQMDNETYQKVNEKVNECDKNGNPFAVFTSKPENPKVNDFVALQSIVGVDIMKYNSGQALVVEGVTVKYKNKKLSFDHLVEIPEGYTSNERHQVTDGKHSQFTDVLETWKNQAEWFTKQGTNRQEKELANYFNRMYIKLRYNKTYTVTVGGKAYDNVAFVDVLDDAIRAASRALTHGVTIGNNRALYLASKRIIKFGRTSDLCLWFAKRTIETLQDISKVVLERIHPNKKYAPWVKNGFVKWWFSHVVDLLQYDDSCPSGNALCMNWDRTHRFPYVSIGEAPVEQFLLKKKRVICQPANSDIIMLERFGEVALKFILTERIIIHGGAYVDKKR